MFNLDRQKIEFPCPACGFYNSAFLRQVRLRDALVCRGCKSNIRLDDHMNEYRKAARRIARSVHALQATLSKLTS